MVGIYTYSFINQENKNSDQVYNIDIIIYQNNTPQNEKWNLDKMSNRFENLINFIENNSKNVHPTAIIFSETEIPYVVSENDKIVH